MPHEVARKHHVPMPLRAELEMQSPKPAGNSRIALDTSTEGAASTRIRRYCLCLHAPTERVLAAAAAARFPLGNGRIDSPAHSPDPRRAGEALPRMTLALRAELTRPGDALVLQLRDLLQRGPEGGRRFVKQY